MSGWNDADVERLRNLNDDIAKAEGNLRHLIGYMRQDGCPWSVIAEALGVTRQAAHKKYRSTRVGLEDVPLPNMSDPTT